MTKLILLIVLVVAAWYLLGGSRPRNVDRRTARPVRDESAGIRSEAVDLQRCPRCGVYIPAAGMSDCPRADCQFVTRPKS